LIIHDVRYVYPVLGPQLGRLIKDVTSVGGTVVLVHLVSLRHCWLVVSAAPVHDRRPLDEPIIPKSLDGFRTLPRRPGAPRGAGEGGPGFATSHSFRKTTATILDAAGVSPCIAADRFGHSWVSMTQDVNFGRRQVDLRGGHAGECRRPVGRTP
jgi:hypothetical protein